MRNLFNVLLVTIGSSLLAAGCDSSSAQGMAGITVEQLDVEGGQFFTPFKDGVLFFGFSDTGHEPWFSDGTPEGTFLLKDINPGSPNSWNQQIDFLVLGDFAYFLANDPVTGIALWRTDGTTEGTHLFADLYPGETGSGAMLNGVVADNRIFLETFLLDGSLDVWVVTDHDVLP